MKEIHIWYIAAQCASGDTAGSGRYGDSRCIRNVNEAGADALQVQRAPESCRKDIGDRVETAELRRPPHVVSGANPLFAVTCRGGVYACATWSLCRSCAGGHDIDARPHVWAAMHTAFQSRSGLISS